MRKGEILNCEKEWIDFDYSIIHVLKSKTGLDRKIPLSPKAKEIFKSALKDATNITEYVFLNSETNKPYTDIKHSFSSVLNKANIENFRFHDLRHTVATRMVKGGADIVVVKEILGHSKIETTMRYTHTDSERKTKAINILDDFMN